MTDQYRQRVHHLRPERVIEAYAQFRGVDEKTLLHGTERTRGITALRHELMWLLQDLTPASHATIGQIIGGRDGSTVSEAIMGIADRMASDLEFRKSLRDVRGHCIHVATSPSEGQRHPIGDGRSMSARMMASVSVLRDGMLSDADARAAALQILTNAMEVPRG